MPYQDGDRISVAENIPKLLNEIVLVHVYALLELMKLVEDDSLALPCRVKVMVQYYVIDDHKVTTRLLYIGGFGLT